MTTSVALSRPTTSARPGVPPGELRDLPEDAGARRARVLLELAQHGPSGVGTLARRCDLPPGVVLAHLQDLADAGFVVVDGRRWAAVSLVERERCRATRGV
ncbi:helix-turn-helix domain-containing protein [Cellulomonas phragmiteti]|uniref:HTH arsR-type domain-containing protein n=1 Tax=Cellulomonas phragmiteti TaxID=478780 RepID=A0ABQ4DQY4_9CELL|nr:helix-turn-helix domain-containing protein [Cellulomonas phragmiteti]GIG41775.1 hypothetical protein Cph01nite_35370 [Cellulomonas phragmiteti]